MGYSRARKTNPACETARFSSSTKRSLKLKVKDRSGGVVDTVKTVLESALKEEVTEFLKGKEKKRIVLGTIFVE